MYPNIYDFWTASSPNKLEKGRNLHYTVLGAHALFAGVPRALKRDPPAHSRNPPQTREIPTLPGLARTLGGQTTEHHTHTPVNIHTTHEPPFFTGGSSARRSNVAIGESALLPAPSVSEADGHHGVGGRAVGGVKRAGAIAQRSRPHRPLPRPCRGRRAACPP